MVHKRATIISPNLLWVMGYGRVSMLLVRQEPPSRIWTTNPQRFDGTNCGMSSCPSASAWTFPTLAGPSRLSDVPAHCPAGTVNFPTCSDSPKNTAPSGVRWFARTRTVPGQVPLISSSGRAASRSSFSNQTIDVVDRGHDNVEIAILLEVGHKNVGRILEPERCRGPEASQAVQVLGPPHAAPEISRHVEIAVVIELVGPRSCGR